MSLVSCGDVCQPLGNLLEDMAGASSPLSKRNKIGAVQSLLSPFNTGMAPQVDQLNGKRRQVEIQYFTRSTENDIVTSAPADCSTSTQRCLNTQTFDIGLYVADEFKIEEKYVAEICEGQGSFFQKNLLASFNALNTKLDKAVFNALEAGVGTNIVTGNTATRTLDLIDGTNGKVKADVYTQFMSEVQNSNLFTGLPMIVGAGNAYAATKLLESACCNDGGVDMMALAQNAPWLMFTDTQTTSALGDADEVLVIEPGSAHFTPWFMYRDLGGSVLGNDGALSAFEVSNGTMRGIVRDPITGMAYNMKVVHDDCNDLFYVRLFLYFDVWTMPTDAYAAGDEFSGYTGILSYKFT